MAVQSCRSEDQNRGLLDGSLVRPINEFTVDESTSLERGLPFERSVVEIVGERRRHCGVVETGIQGTSIGPLYLPDDH